MTTGSDDERASVATPGDDWRAAPLRAHIEWGCLVVEIPTALWDFGSPMPAITGASCRVSPTFHSDLAQSSAYLESFEIRAGSRRTRAQLVQVFPHETGTPGIICWCFKWAAHTTDEELMDEQRAMLMEPVTSEAGQVLEPDEIVVWRYAAGDAYTPPPNMPDSS